MSEMLSFRFFVSLSEDARGSQQCLTTNNLDFHGKYLGA
jgi:hypothetical protein